MDESKRLHMRRAHADRSHRCVCGRVVFGNGAKSHYRHCRVHLRERGWPLQSSWIETFVNAGMPGAETARKVEMGLGRWSLDNSLHDQPGQPNRLPWAEFKDLIWTLAEQPTVQS